MCITEFSNKELEMIEFTKTVESFSMRDFVSRFKINEAAFLNFLSRCESHGILFMEFGKARNIRYAYFKEVK